MSISEMEKYTSFLKFSVIVLLGVFFFFVEFRDEIVSYSPGPISRTLYRYANMKYLHDEPPFRKLKAVRGKHHPSENILSIVADGVHANRSMEHRSAWMHLEEVDGLKNTDVVMVVTSTTAKDGYLLRER